MGWDGPITNRHVLLWNAFFALEMDRPSRTDFYLMRVAHEAFYSNRDYPKTVNLEPFIVSFGQDVQPKKMISKQAATAQLKAKWFMALNVSAGDIEEVQPYDSDGAGDSGSQANG